MPLPKDRLFTIEDIYKLPDGQRAELIDGVIYDMAPPSYKHQKIVSELTRIIGNYIKSKDGQCDVLPAPFAVFLNKDNKKRVLNRILVSYATKSSFQTAAAKVRRTG